MCTVRAECLAIFFCLLLPSATRAALTLAVPQYKMGETATVDVVSPLHLIVINHERTEKLRLQEAERLSPIFRFYPAAADEADAALRSAFAAGREKFLDSLEANYSRRKLSELALSYPRFQRLVASLQKDATSSPLNTNLAALWALGVSDEPVQRKLITKLREIMARPIQADASAAESKTGIRHIKMLAMAPGEAAPDLARVEKDATNFAWADVYPLSRARQEVQEGFPAEEQEFGKFAAGFVEENCVFDPDLTEQSRRKLTQDIWAADEYEPGQLVIECGETINLRSHAVLEQLRERLASDQAKRDLIKEKISAQTVATRFQQETARAQTAAQLVLERNRWIMGGMGAAGLLFLLFLWRLTRWKRSRALLPAQIYSHEAAGTVVCCPSCLCTIVLPLELTAPASPRSLPAPSPVPLPATVEVPQLAVEAEWKERALVAEQRVEKTRHLLRAALIPELARWLMSKVVQGLALQGRELQQTQQRAEQELAELEKRLAGAQAPLEERLKAYEQRIGELENDLSAKGEENRELIKTTIAMVRKRLETERSKERAGWN
jgi:hypothetical protein